VGLTYRSPHKFRHGHIQYGLTHSESLAYFKAVSMNVMHSSVKITDAVYIKLSDSDIRSRIATVRREEVPPSDDLEETFELFQEFFDWRKAQKQ
jgi:integrase